MEIAPRYSLLLGINFPGEISSVEEARKLLGMNWHQVGSLKNRVMVRSLSDPKAYANAVAEKCHKQSLFTIDSITANI
jgi:hypothetical protein